MPPRVWYVYYIAVYWSPLDDFIMLYFLLIGCDSELIEFVRECCERIFWRFIHLWKGRLNLFVRLFVAVIASCKRMFRDDCRLIITYDY